MKYGFGKLEWRSHTTGAKWLDGRGRKLFMKLSVAKSKLCTQREETERRKLDRKASCRVGRRAKWGRLERERQREREKKEKARDEL